MILAAPLMGALSTQTTTVSASSVVSTPQATGHPLNLKGPIE